MCIICIVLTHILCFLILTHINSFSNNIPSIKCCFTWTGEIENKCLLQNRQEFKCELPKGYNVRNIELGKKNYAYVLYVEALKNSWTIKVTWNEDIFVYIHYIYLYGNCKYLLSYFEQHTIDNTNL